DLSVISCCHGADAVRQCPARILIHSLNFTHRFFRRPDFLAVSARHQGHEAAEGDTCARSEVSRSASRCRAARDGRHAGGRQCQRACRGGPRASQRRTCLRDQRSKNGEEMEVPSRREEWTGRTGAGDGGDEVREVAENSCQWPVVGRRQLSVKTGNWQLTTGYRLPLSPPLPFCAIIE